MITCEAGAVKVARDEIEYQKIKTEYDDDIMTIQKLFQGRYEVFLNITEKHKMLREFCNIQN